MAVNLKGRSFLTLMDFTPSEIRYMLDLAHDLKAKKRAGIYNYLFYSRRLRPEPDAPLKLQLWKKEPMSRIWIKTALRWVKRNPWRIRRKYWADSMMVLNTEAISNQQ